MPFLLTRITLSFIPLTTGCCCQTNCQKNDNNSKVYYEDSFLKSCHGISHSWFKKIKLKKRTQKNNPFFLLGQPLGQKIRYVFFIRWCDLKFMAGYCIQRCWWRVWSCCDFSDTVHWIRTCWYATKSSTGYGAAMLNTRHRPTLSCWAVAVCLQGTNEKVLLMWFWEW